MAVAESNSYTRSSYRLCSSYRCPSLIESILDSNETGNLSDKYVLGKQLGWGQFGVIRECTDKLSGEVLACKSIAKDRLVTQEDVRSIKLEIEIMTRLSGHPNVVDLKAVYEEEDYVHLVMELCAGGELFHKLEKHGRFSEPEARAFFRHLMQVVMYCHDKGQSLHGTVGSPFYIAPEVLAGGYDQAADVWSAGVILYILLSGIPPFWGKTKSRIFDAVRAADLRFPSNPWDFISDSAKELIKGMLCTDTSRRLTAQQVLAGGFSFHSSAGSSTLEFATPVLALSSFAFFSSSCEVEKQNDARIDLIPRAGDMDLKAVEDRQGGSSGARILGIRSRRNHTIGVGEFEHFDLTVTESVIRWASCTNLPTATSFRSSLQLASTPTIKQTQIPKSNVYNVEFKTLGACKLGISRYPDFEYNADGVQVLGQQQKSWKVLIQTVKFVLILT
ncbi:hypothetical protein DH2020_040314 [Rehmannia glutinosa]|uniref:Protein kinase domain-containing protein n=1 Tax=Rehmannia glutinosa TaxID=99300 RepID=A0ABR0UVE1_REHGL